jgi:hypothetical protein
MDGAPGHPAKGPGLKPLDSIGLIQGAEAPCSLRKTTHRHIQRFIREG